MQFKNIFKLPNLTEQNIPQIKSPVSILLKASKFHEQVMFPFVEVDKK